MEGGGQVCLVVMPIIMEKDPNQATIKTLKWPSPATNQKTNKA